MKNYEYQMIIIFQIKGEYMFEFGIAEIAKLFLLNPSIPPGINNIEKGRIFIISGKCYIVENLVFDFFLKTPLKAFDGRLIVNIIPLQQNAQSCEDNAVIIPDDLINKIK